MNIGVVGCGAVVQEYYVQILPKLEGCTVTSVADLNVGAATQVATILGAQVRSLSDLIATSEWILIATPPESHFKIASEALEKGRNVVVEKPFVSRFSDGEQLVSLAQSKGVALCVAQFRRVFPTTQLARELISGGQIGEVVGLELFEGGKFAWTAFSNYVSQSRYGGVLFDTGSHTVDQALFAAGLELEPLHVELESVSRDKPEPSHEIEASFRLLTGSQTVRGRLFLSRAQTLANVIRIQGTRGWLEFDIGVAGNVFLGGAGKTIRLTADGGVKSYGAAFSAEYRDIFANGRESLFRADSTLNQLRILEAIHQHG